ncbi:heterocyst-inhibiting protein PatX [Calothrix rhizosoleniae]|uniref:heterocyst-inhibiting protein PatX n=1 Tax=Calothrix rhizosoleniae TaxID=888997 RepID=UPI0011773FD2|nr:hypothetical protein [Calothrix rhizosoleniae]
MRASILLFVTTVVFGSVNLNYLQNQEVSFFSDSESTTLAAYGNQKCHKNGQQKCQYKGYRGSGRRNIYRL